MCRNTLSVGWDGTLYDCDFNQMLDLPLAGKRRHIRDFDRLELDGPKYRTRPALLWLHGGCRIELWGGRRVR